MFVFDRRRRRGAVFHLQCATALLALTVFPALAASPLTLQQAVTLAVERAPLVQAGRAREDAARADRNRAGRWPDPSLDFGVQNLPVQGPGAFIPAAGSMTMRTVGFSQEIPSGAALAAERAGARAGAAAASAETEQARLHTRQAAAAAWVSLWAARRARAQLEGLERQNALVIVAAKARLAGGTGSTADALAAQAAQAELANRLDQADATIAAARAALARWVGAAAAQATLADPPDFTRLPVTAAHLLQSPDAQAPLLDWESREDRAEAALQSARASKHPGWNVDLSYGRVPGLPALATLMVGVRLPLFPAHREDQDILARRADLEAVRAERENARRAQIEAVQRLLATWRGYGRQVRRDRDTLLSLAADRSAAALAAYRGGASLQPWLEARRDEISTRLDYVGALNAWGDTWVQLAYLLPEYAQ
ncbi:TolC family protein [Metallibacterium sp.]|uniref:TolC family protein n=1 Tax=Metallibacterium sp. TaxID=2940281 RepID=UPI00261D67B3|nr:TolC family protein [Metallibacterium sp.]